MTAIGNLVPRVSSLLYLYSGIQEAVRQSDWMFAILLGNSVLCRVNSRGMSKFNVKPYSLPIPTIICNLCGECFSNLELRQIFAPNKLSLYSHYTNLPTPDYCSNSFKKVEMRSSKFLFSISQFIF